MTRYLYDRTQDAVVVLNMKDPERPWIDTDAGARLDSFVVEAKSPADAEEIAREWIALWADEDRLDVGDLGLIERRDHVAVMRY